MRERALRFGALMVMAMALGASLVAQVARDMRPVPGAAGKSAIRGVVVSADLGKPVRRVTVNVAGGDPRTMRSIQTDEQGGFEFADLPAGEYTLTAEKPGFVESAYGQIEPGSGRPGTPIRLLAAQQLKDVSLRIAHGGVITGRVLDDVGDPAFGINVRVYRLVMKSGERTYQPAESAMTDDRGIYRIPTLLAGDYVVGVSSATTANVPVKFNGTVEYSRVLETFDFATNDTSFAVRLPVRAAPGTAPKTGFLPAFYPGVAQVSAATSITLGPSEERPGVDFNLQIVPLAQISGTVTGATGPVGGASVQIADSAQPPGFGSRAARTGPDGRFVFDSMPPGQYSLMTRAVPKGAPQLESSGREAVEFLTTAADGKVMSVSKAINAVAEMWASADVVVDGRDVADVNLVLQPGLTISGRVTVDAGAEPAFARMAVGFAPMGLQKGDQATIGPAAVDVNGSFAIKGVTPGRYRLVAMSMPSGFLVASAVFGGQDTLDIPIDINGSSTVGEGLVTLTTKTTEVQGHILDPAGNPASGVTVIVYPAEERFWVAEARRIQAVRPSTDGRYQFKNLPPGDYRLIAVSDIEPGRWYDPTLLRQLAGFATLTVSPGGKHVQDFRLK